jgi:hypothetical protein
VLAATPEAHPETIAEVLASDHAAREAARAFLPEVAAETTRVHA